MPSKSKEELAEEYGLTVCRANNIAPSEIHHRDIAIKAFLAGYAAGLESDEAVALKHLMHLSMHHLCSAHEHIKNSGDDASELKTFIVGLDEALQAFQSKYGGAK